MKLLTLVIPLVFLALPLMAQEPGITLLHRKRSAIPGQKTARKKRRLSCCIISTLKAADEVSRMREPCCFPRPN